MNSSAPGVVKRRSRYARRFSSVDSTPIVSKRFLIVPPALVGGEDPLALGDERARGLVQFAGHSNLLWSLVSGLHYGRATIAAPRE